MAATVVDLAQIQKLTNLGDVTRLLHETVARERTIDMELDRQLSKRTDLERNFLLLNTPTAETLELVRADCEQLLSSVQATAQLADAISSKVRRLDLVQGRVQGVLSKINLILDRTNCINGVQAAMETEDYEAAAHYISSFMEVEAKLQAAAAGQLQPIALMAAADPGQAEEQRRVLLEARSKLEAVVEKRFEDAVARRDHAAAVRFAKLYKPLGKQAEGLKRFTEFLKLLVGAQARAAYSALDQQLEAAAGSRQAKIDFAAALTALFKDIALCLEEHEALVRDTFGEEAQLDVIAALQAECDNAGARILQRYAESRRLERLVRDVTSRRRGAPQATSGAFSVVTGATGAAPQQDPALDHRAVEGHIEELLRICGLCEEYNQFILAKMRMALAAAAAARATSATPASPTAVPPQALPAAREAAFRSGAFNVALRELLGRYVSLEEYYLDETVNMAIRIDEVLGDAPTSSMVDDAFFILRKVGLRALASGQFQASAALLAELNNVLANAFRNALQAKMGAGPTKLLAALPAGAAPPDAEPPAVLREHCVALNNADVAGDYATKLRAELEGALQGLLSSAADRDRARSVLGDLAKTGGDFRSMAARGLEALADGLMPRLRPNLDELAMISYSMGEAEYAASEVEDGWAGRLLAGLAGIAGWLRTPLTANNWEVLFGSLLDKVVGRLEAVLMRKQFSQLGGLQLDRDVRFMVATLSELTSRTVRDRLARLSQMSLLLGLESAEELLDYWGGPGGGSGGDAGAGAGGGVGGPMNWRLTAAEARAVLALRSDFSKDAIMALPL